MWQKFDTFELGSDFTAWGVAIARHFILKLQSKQYDKRIIYSSEVVALMEQNHADDCQDFAEDASFIEQGIKQLTPEDANLLHMKYQQGKTTVEIAQITGRPLGGLYKVMARIHRDLSKHVMHLKKGDSDEA